MGSRWPLGAGIVGALLVVLVVLVLGRAGDGRYPGPLQADLERLGGAPSEDGATDGPAGDDTAGPGGTEQADGEVEVTASTEVTHDTVWLCGPDAEVDLCLDDDLDTTVIAADGSRTVVPFTPAEDPSVDCFYVYPTVSEAAGTNAPLEITDAERDVVRAQAARFGEVCRVVAPLYRQVTRGALLRGGFSDAEARDLAFGDVLSAWNDHVATSGERPFVLVGHSQGAYDLTRLLAERIEGDPELRPRLVSALLLGAEVTVPVEAGASGSFRTVLPCDDVTDTGCVVAYNSFAEQPPPGAIFGRGGFGVDVLCVHPGAPGGGVAPLTPVLPVPAGGGTAAGDVDTPFVVIEGAVDAECRTEGTVSWLEVDLDPSATFDLGAIAAGPGPGWGLHTLDVNLALGELVELVRTQAGAFS